MGDDISPSPVRKSVAKELAQGLLRPDKLDVEIVQKTEGRADVF